MPLLSEEPNLSKCINESRDSEALHGSNQSAIHLRHIFTVSAARVFYEVKNQRYAIFNLI